MNSNDNKWQALCDFAKHGAGYFADPREPWDVFTRPSVKQRHRKPSLARAKKQAAKAGLDVARFEITGTGISVVPASPDQGSTTIENPWDQVQ
jgi:hypothetical protein